MSGPSSRRFCTAALGLAGFVLAGCGFAPPVQTYSPGSVPLPAPMMPMPTANGSSNQLFGPDVAFPDSVPDFAAPPPTQTTAAPGQAVAICYSRLWNSPDSVRAAASQACGTGATPRIVSQDLDLSACPVLTPTHAVYFCAGPTAEGQSKTP